jgi:23S rRNA (cytosine1962-C5)-methyltransferase
MEIIAQEIKRRMPVNEESRRLFHGRGHCFQGFEDVLIDWYKPIVLVSLYEQRTEPWLSELVDLLQKYIPGLSAVLLQERYLVNGPVRTLWGQLDAPVDAVESGCRFRLRLGNAQNIGFFPDMAQGRSLVHSLSTQKRVLNLFAYTCSFSVAALTGGAEQVVNLDMNRGALELGRLNHELNDLDLRRASFLPVELFRSMNKLKRLGPFDLIICDPPAYQGKSFKAERDWSKLLRKIPAILAQSGTLIACLNGPHLPPEFLQQLISELRPEMKLVQQLQPGTDFPEVDASRGSWLFHYQRQSATMSPQE